MNNPYPPNADATQAGLMTPTQVNALATAQADATQAKTWSDPASSKTMGNVGTTQTFAGIIVNFIRAVAATLVLRSTLGASSSDKCVQLGTEQSDGSTNQLAPLTWVGTGIGGTETQSFAFLKGGILAGTSLVAGFLRLNGANGAQLDYGSSKVQCGGVYTEVRSASGTSRLISQATTGVLNRIGSSAAVSAAATQLATFSSAVDSTAADRACITYAGEFESLVAGAGVVLKSPDGTRWRVTVDNSGALGVAAA